MYEQQSYNQAAAAQPKQAGGLFQNYEIKSWEITPRIYKFIAASAIFNILVLTVFTQGNLLTRRGCDSPFASTICQVVDTIYVGAMLATTDRETIDAAYEKIDLGDADITYIDVSGETPPLDYPEGYFQIANPVQYAMMQQQAIDPANSGSSYIQGFPGFNQNPTSGSIMDVPAITPQANPNALNGEPKSPFSIAGGDNPTISGGRKGRGGRPVNRTPSIDEVNKVETAEKTDEKPEEAPVVTVTDPITGDEINNRPFTDLGKFVSETVDKKEVDLQSEFVLNAKGKLNKDGKLDQKTFRYIKTESTDKKLIEIVQESIEAFNDSGRLKVLEQLSGKDLDLMVQQDGTNITAVVQSELESENRAKSMQSSLGILLAAAKQFKGGADASQNDKDDLVLLEGAKIESDGKKLVIRFTVPKEIIHQMIQRKLAQQKLDSKKPSGTAVVTPNNNTAEK